MYLRTNHTQGDIRIPENYRGNAFRADEPTAPPPSAVERVNFESEYENTPLPVPNNTLAPIFVDKSLTETVSERPSPPKSTLLSSLMPPKPERFTSSLLGDIGLEELIIIGVILLLSQSDVDDDILLLLAVLLFYK